MNETISIAAVVGGVIGLNVLIMILWVANRNLSKSMKHSKRTLDDHLKTIESDRKRFVILIEETDTMTAMLDARNQTISDLKHELEVRLPAKKKPAEIKCMFCDYINPQTIAPIRVFANNTCPLCDREQRI